MNRQIVAALFWDAVYQVLDNKVFRILAGLVGVLVLSTFIIGARDDSLVLLFGWKEIFYEDIFAFFDWPYPGLEGAGEIVIQNVQSVLIDSLAGTLGIMLAVAATAFFVPRMLEKGAADTLFSKPVGRFALLLSRYMAGLFFVALLAIALVGGMQLGFLLNSGYSDPGFLWSILTLIYVFGLLHGFSILVGVLTRSTVAAILLTLLFSVFTGCVHTSWRVKEFALEDFAREAQIERDAAEAEGVEPEEEDPDEMWKRILFRTLDTVHFVLPKTTDAPTIARKMRHDLERRYAELWDGAGGLLVAGTPQGWERTGDVEDLAGEGVVWASPGGEGTLRLSRRPLKGTNRIRAARALKEVVENRPGVSEVDEGRGRVAQVATSQVLWLETVDGVERRHRANVFMGGGQLYTFEIEGDPEWYLDEEVNRTVQGFANGFTFNEGENATDPFARFDARLGWDSPWAYNIWFSILSSLAFLAVVLGIAWLRLARVDF